MPRRGATRLFAGQRPHGNQCASLQKGSLRARDGRREKKGGGERGIRTLGAAINDTHDFQSCSFSQLGHLSASGRSNPILRLPGLQQLCTFPGIHCPDHEANRHWRRGWDSNPRSHFWQDTAFRERGLQPLGHLSAIHNRPSVKMPSISFVAPFVNPQMILK